MHGFADDRGFEPLLDDTTALGVHTHVAGRVSSESDAGRRKRRSAKEMLDSIGGLGWSVLGFIGGAVFWHFVGFWGFVSDVLLAKESFTFLPAEASAVYAPPPEIRSRWLQVADGSAPSCTLLSLDRLTGLTSARPCDGEHAPLPADSYQGREDRVPARASDAPQPDAND